MGQPGYGINIEGGKHNRIFHNNFRNNNWRYFPPSEPVQGPQACDNGARNPWNDRYPLGGNYWNDDDSPDNDGDGIRDSPHDRIDGTAGAKDYYPLVNGTSVIMVDDDGGGDYVYIQDAVDAADERDAVYVYPGTYCETITITTEMIVLQRISEMPVIDGEENGTVVYINTDWVTMKGLAVKNSGSMNAGIRVLGDNNYITENKAFDNSYGIWLLHADNNLVRENDCSGNSGYGVFFSDSNHNTLSGNTCSENRLDGIRLDGSNYNIVSNNTASSNSNGLDGYSGIYLDESDFNHISCNILDENDYGMRFHGGCDNNRIHHNTISSNTNYGMWVQGSNDANLIYNNNFDNTDQAYDAGANNQWDNGDSSGGNCWSDHHNGDPYVILPNGIDNSPIYPLPITVYHVSEKEGDDVWGDGSKEHPYRTISKGIDEADTADAIYVHCGIYAENIDINKMVALVGESTRTVTIHGDGSDDVVTIEHDRVAMGNLKVTGSAPGKAGIYAIAYRHIYIFGNECLNNGIGIYLYLSDDSTITNNICMNNNGYGIFLFASVDCTIMNNTCSLNSDYGIYLKTSDRNTLTYNTSSSNDLRGIYIYSCILTGENILSYNSCLENGEDGIYLEQTSENDLMGNMCTGNGGSGLVLDGSDSNIIRENIFDSNEGSDTNGGIEIEDSDQNLILDNVISGNTEYGIYINAASGSSTGNDICFNSLSNNGSEGIYIAEGDSLDNTIYHNNFSDNNPGNSQAYDNSSDNLWGGGYPRGGNHWTDHISPDSNLDGIVDNPYTIGGSGGSKDEAPLVQAVGMVFYVDDDEPTDGTGSWGHPFSTIQQALDFVSAGDVILVKDGTYYSGTSEYDPIVISKSVTLEAFLDDQPVIIDEDGGDDDIVLIEGNGAEADYVALGGFTIVVSEPDWSGVWIKSSHNRIYDNVITIDDGYGIYFYASEYNAIGGNICTGVFGQDTEYGFFLDGSHHNTLLNNACSNNDAGIYLGESDDNTLIQNGCSGNTNGIYLWRSNDNVLSDNLLHSNTDDGICLRDDSSNNKLHHNDIVENGRYGIRIREGSNENEIHHNVIHENSNYGIRIENAGGGGNTIHHNNFINWKSSTHRTPFHLTNEGSTHRTLSCL